VTKWRTVIGSELEFAEGATMGIRQFVLIILSATLLFSCKAAIRDPKVYAAELDFIDAATDEQVARGKALIQASCRCSEVMGVYGFDMIQCHELAETVLVVEARVAYHTAFMRYLGGLTKERPPKESPGIPDPNTLCPR
jgi:hypothetical protein